jgi:hypothetical protein
MVWKMSKKKERANLWKFFESEDPALGKMGLSMTEGLFGDSDIDWTARKGLADMADERWEEAVTDVSNFLRRLAKPEVTGDVDWKIYPEMRFQKSYWDWIGSVLRHPWDMKEGKHWMEDWVVEDYEKLKKEKAKKD